MLQCRTFLKTENIQHIPGYASFGTVVSDEDPPPLFDWLPPASIILPLYLSFMLNIGLAMAGGAGGKNETSEPARLHEKIDRYAVRPWTGLSVGGGAFSLSLSLGTF